MPKKTEDKELLSSIVGMYIHIMDDEGFVKYQGRIVGKEDDFYIVKMFEWVTGCYSNHELFKSQYLSEFGRVRLHYDAESMNEWYKYHAPKRKYKDDNKDGKLEFLTFEELSKSGHTNSKESD